MRTIKPNPTDKCVFRYRQSYVPSFRLLPSVYNQIFERRSDNETLNGSCRKLWGAVEYLIDVREKLICRSRFEFWSPHVIEMLNCILRSQVTGLTWPNLRSNVIFCFWRTGKEKKKNAWYIYCTSRLPPLRCLPVNRDVILCHAINVSQSNFTRNSWVWLEARKRQSVVYMVTFQAKWNVKKSLLRSRNQIYMKRIGGT